MFLFQKKHFFTTMSQLCSKLNTLKDQLIFWCKNRPLLTRICSMRGLSGAPTLQPWLHSGPAQNFSALGRPVVDLL